MDRRGAATALHTRTRFRLITATPEATDFGADVRRGLTSKPKSLPPRYFYDLLGSSLFEAICRTDEYYVTRAETEIFEEQGAAIAAALGSPSRLIELGSGNARKTRILLDAVTEKHPEVQYIPVDVDAKMLTQLGSEMAVNYPAMMITAVCADFSKPSRALEAVGRGGRTAVLFLGSSIGNLDPHEASLMLRDLRSILARNELVLLGIDLRKPKAVLNAAYNDAVGVTAAFNRNLLARINRELGGEFDLTAFDHSAFFSEEKSRIEMHLVSTKAQKVRIEALELTVSFEAGETIHTENSYKYDDAGMEKLAHSGGFQIERIWTDSRGYFADLLLRPA